MLRIQQHPELAFVVIDFGTNGIHGSEVRIAIEQRRHRKQQAAQGAVDVQTRKAPSRKFGPCIKPWKRLFQSAQLVVLIVSRVDDKEVRVLLAGSGGHQIGHLPRRLATGTEVDDLQRCRGLRLPHEPLIPAGERRVRRHVVALRGASPKEEHSTPNRVFGCGNARPPKHHAARGGTRRRDGLIVALKRQRRNQAWRSIGNGESQQDFRGGQQRDGDGYADQQAGGSGQCCHSGRAYQKGTIRGASGPL